MDKQYKPSGRFSVLGMIGTLGIGSVGAIVIGLIIYGFGYFLNFSIPLLFPFIAGMTVGLLVQNYGEKIGKSRNPFLSLTIAVICAFIAWGTIHVTDFILFRGNVYSDIYSEIQNIEPEEVSYIFNSWLEHETGSSGIIGFLFLKSNSSNVEISYLYSGATTPPLFRITGVGLIAYWFVELAIMIASAVVTNKDYAKKPYCEECEVRRKATVPIFGDDTYIDEVVSDINSGEIKSALKQLTKSEEGNLVRFVVEHCPNCFDSLSAKLIVVIDTGPKTWMEQTAWEGKFQPNEIKTILDHDGSL